MRKIHGGLFLILSFSLLSQLVAQQTDNELFSISTVVHKEEVLCDQDCKHNPHHDHVSVKYPFISFRDDLTFLSRLAIRGYQIFISSQNQPACMFEPSCSAFALEAIQAYGIKGFFLSADRVSRCNSLGSIYYDETSDKGKFKDPPENYFN